MSKDAVLARIDTTEILAQLAAAKAGVHRSHQGVANAEANVAVREAELKLSDDVELKRAAELTRTNYGHPSGTGPSHGTERHLTGQSG
ncbi:hypothetical protein ACVOMV_26095 (plasmid) [Mesorhizobium atlanticum]|uniref:hypothetical protein n=1 Tax=Mesorhizobium atlanticum TaxID=2233532 RepID=UPI003703788C